MADSHVTKSGSNHREEIQLKIISPSPEIGPLTFPSISTSFTVAQLKQKISDASETKVPLPIQQRLIFRGHVLAQEQRTLKEIFGQDTVCSSTKLLCCSSKAHGNHRSITAMSHTRFIWFLARERITVMDHPLPHLSRELKPPLQ